MASVSREQMPPRPHLSPPRTSSSRPAARHRAHEGGVRSGRSLARPAAYHPAYCCKSVRSRRVQARCSAAAAQAGHSFAVQAPPGPPRLQARMTCLLARTMRVRPVGESGTARISLSSPGSARSERTMRYGIVYIRFCGAETSGFFFRGFAPPPFLSLFPHSF